MNIVRRYFTSVFELAHGVVRALLTKQSLTVIAYSAMVIFTLAYIN